MGCYHLHKIQTVQQVFQISRVPMLRTVFMCWAWTHNLNLKHTGPVMFIFVIFMHFSNYKVWKKLNLIHFRGIADDKNFKSIDIFVRIWNTYLEEILYRN